MSSITNLSHLLKNIHPILNEGQYVFYTAVEELPLSHGEVVMSFKEQEGTTIIVEKSIADRLNLDYTFVASWITLTVHSSLEAVGLTAAFSNALAENKISCNVVAAFYHDHIFVASQDAEKAMKVLKDLGNEENKTFIK
jgi:uncharacterized protein